MSNPNPQPPKRRKKVIQKNPNPLFEQWITEWKDEAESKGWKTKYVYQKALKSLRSYPLKLKSGKEAKILEFFGDKMCKMLDEKLKEHRKAHDISDESGEDDVTSQSQPSSESSKQSSQKHSAPKTSSPAKSPKKAAKPRMYVPTPGTGPFAILVTLFLAEEQEDKHFMKKGELQEAAQKICDTSFTVPQAGSHYTAWSSMSTLITKGLIIKDGNPARYSLSSSGKELGCRLAFSTDDEHLSTPLETISLNSATITKTISQLEYSSSNSASNSGTNSQTDYTSKSASTIHTNRQINSVPSLGSDSQSKLSSFSSIKSSQLSNRDSQVTDSDEDIEAVPAKVFVPEYTLKPGEFSVILCVDNCETQGGSKGCSKNNIIPELQKNGVPFEIRKLHVGDFLWVAKQRVAPIPGQLRAPEPIELVLDHVVERKRLDDLAQSIKDGRYKEQKFRLKKSGIRHPTYLIEQYGTNSYNVGLPEKTLKQACSNTQINGGFVLKITKDQKDSVAYLTIMTRHLQKIYNGKTLLSCTKDEIKEPNLCPPNAFLTFKQFNTESRKRKNFVVRELFVLQLMKLKGLSQEKAIAITKLYETPKRLIEAYRNCQTLTEKEKMLCFIKVPPSNRNLGPALSKTIYQLYNFEKLT